MRTAGCALPVVAALTVAALAAPAFADAPPLLPVQGTLYDVEGAPIHDTLPVEFTLYGDPDGSMPLWSDVVLVDFVDGTFTAYLGEDDPINHVIFRDYAQVFVGVAVNGDDEMPLFGLATSPYAGFAAYCGDANTLGGQTAEDIVYDAMDSARVEFAPIGHRTAWASIDDVPAGFADGVDNDTQLTEAQVDAFVANNGFLTSLAVTAGLIRGGTATDVTLSVDPAWLQRRVGASCPAQHAIRAIYEDGTVLCEPFLRVTCTRSGWIYGDQGCVDDAYITCEGGVVTNIRFNC